MDFDLKIVVLKNTYTRMKIKKKRTLISPLRLNEWFMLRYKMRILKKNDQEFFW